MIDQVVRNNRSTLKLTMKVVGSYVANNSVPSSALPGLIESVYGAISALGTRNDKLPSYGAAVVKPTAIQIRRSIQKDGLVSFIDGGVYQTLKRHLTSHGLHEKSYRERYGLPSDYPMVSPSYSARRSMLAIAAGLGSRRSVAVKMQRKRTKAVAVNGRSSHRSS